MQREADAVVAHAILAEIVSADFLGTVAGLDLSAAFGPNRSLLLFHFQFVQARAEYAHGLRAVLDLRFLVLLRYDQPAGNVRDTHRGVRGVDGLPARTRGAKRIDAQVLRFDLDVDVVGFRQDRDGGCRRVDASLRFGSRDALYAVDAALVLQLGINLVALDRHHDFFQP